ncbi:MAG TPA: methylated-DNA--[protein]-cysteine S-methyltransferase [Acidimicrobiia bacterium]|jgi:methylated-DNA-[protein]-cysteine S-methyltransferase|nr:methylated-DNA--[protein]-cysteine S-methyltransferase [Acidimicrobiia bacterium]
MTERLDDVDPAVLLDGAAAPVPSSLHERFVARADDEGLLDVAYTTIDTRIGPLLLAASPRGLLRVAFALEGFDAVVAELADSVSPRVLRAPGRLDTAARQVDGYLDGTVATFDLPLDLRLARGFRRDVLEHLRTIPYGRTESYTVAARGAGRPAAVRAAASACSHNPIPLVIPCHRVVRSDGSVGDYRGGTALKRDLLEMESAA